MSKDTNTYMREDKNGKLVRETPLVRKVRKENYGLFIIRGMRSNLYHLRALEVFPHSCKELEEILVYMDTIIRSDQKARKEAKRNETQQTSSNK